MQVAAGGVDHEPCEREDERQRQQDDVCSQCLSALYDRAVSESPATPRWTRHLVYRAERTRLTWKLRFGLLALLAAGLWLTSGLVDSLDCPRPRLRGHGVAERCHPHREPRAQLPALRACAASSASRPGAAGAGARVRRSGHAGGERRSAGHGGTHREAFPHRTHRALPGPAGRADHGNRCARCPGFPHARAHPFRHRRDADLPQPPVSAGVQAPSSAAPALPSIVSRFKDPVASPTGPGAGTGSRRWRSSGSSCSTTGFPSCRFEPAPHSTDQ